MLGHQVDSVASLRLKGLDNSRLYREAAQSYELCFTKDRAFVANVRAVDRPGSVKVFRVTLPQAAGQEFTRRFVDVFQQTDRSAYPNGSDWP